MKTLRNGIFKPVQINCTIIYDNPEEAKQWSSFAIMDCNVVTDENKVYKLKVKHHNVNLRAIGVFLP
jgi:hypothetical protein